MSLKPIAFTTKDLGQNVTCFSIHGKFPPLVDVLCGRVITSDEYELLDKLSSIGGDSRVLMYHTDKAHHVTNALYIVNQAINALRIGSQAASEATTTPKLADVGGTADRDFAPPKPDASDSVASADVVDESSAAGSVGNAPAEMRDVRLSSILSSYMEPGQLERGCVTLNGCVIFRVVPAADSPLSETVKAKTWIAARYLAYGPRMFKLLEDVIRLSQVKEQREEFERIKCRLDKPYW